MLWLLYSQGQNYQFMLDRSLVRSQGWYGCANEEKIPIGSHFIDFAILVHNIKICNSWENDWLEVSIINTPHGLSIESSNESESV
jgi:hypothetical protein